MGKNHKLELAPTSYLHMRLLSVASVQWLCGKVWVEARSEYCPHFDFGFGS